MPRKIAGVAPTSVTFKTRDVWGVLGILKALAKKNHLQFSIVRNHVYDSRGHYLHSNMTISVDRTTSRRR